MGAADHAFRSLGRGFRCRRVASGLRSSQPTSSSVVASLHPTHQARCILGQVLGAMAPRGRKRKAEAAMVAAAEKQEKLANSGEGMEEATVVIEHW